jgi:hypothetical protein
LAMDTLAAAFGATMKRREQWKPEHLRVYGDVLAMEDAEAGRAMAQKMLTRPLRGPERAEVEKAAMLLAAETALVRARSDSSEQRKAGQLIKKIKSSFRSNNPARSLPAIARAATMNANAGHQSRQGGIARALGRARPSTARHRSRSASQRRRVSTSADKGRSSEDEASEQEPDEDEVLVS